MAKQKPNPVEKESHTCLKEIHAILERRGFALISVPNFRQNPDGSFAVTVDLHIKKVNKEAIHGNG